LPIGDLSKIIKANPIPEFIPYVIERFQKAGSFRSAEQLAESLILPVATQLSYDQLLEIHTAIESNPQIWDASGIKEILVDLFDRTITLLPQSGEAWIALYNAIDAKTFHSDRYAALKIRLEKEGFELPEVVPEDD